MVAQTIMCYLHKHENLSSILRTDVKSQTWCQKKFVMSALVRWRQDDLWGLLESQPSITSEPQTLVKDKNGR